MRRSARLRSGSALLHLDSEPWRESAPRNPSPSGAADAPDADMLGARREVREFAYNMRSQFSVGNPRR